VTRGVYVIHIEPPFHHARHYVGFSKDILARLALHQLGQSQVALIRAAVLAGHRLILAHVWPDADRNFERRIKNRKNTPRYCPICQGKAPSLPQQLVTHRSLLSS
jgi:hypothetical protein